MEGWKPSVRGALSVLLVLALSYVFCFGVGGLVTGGFFINNHLYDFEHNRQWRWPLWSLGVLLCLLQIFLSTFLRKKSKFVEANILFIAAATLIYVAIYEAAYFYTIGLKDNLLKFPMSLLMMLFTLLCGLYAVWQRSMTVAIYGAVAGCVSVFSFSRINLPFLIGYLTLPTLAYCWIGKREKWIPVIALSVFGFISSLVYVGFLYLVSSAIRG